MNISRELTEEITSREYILEHLRACVVSQNAEVFKDKNIVSRAILDLAVIYRVVVDFEENERGSFIINETILKKAELTEKELFDVAKANKDYEINNLFKEIIGLMKLEIGEECNFPEVYVVSSTDKFYGASVLITDVLNELLPKNKDGYYIIPCSVHELILAPYQTMVEPEKIVELIKQVNETEVEPKDRLSDSLYFMDKDGIRIIA